MFLLINNHESKQKTIIYNMSKAGRDDHKALRPRNTVLSDAFNLEEFSAAVVTTTRESSDHVGDKVLTTSPENIAGRRSAVLKQWSVAVKCSSGTDLRSLQCCKRLK